MNKGKFYQKLHHLQKLVSRLLKLGKKDDVKILEIQEHHLIEKIKRITDNNDSSSLIAMYKLADYSE